MQPIAQLKVEPGGTRTEESNTRRSMARIRRLTGIGNWNPIAQLNVVAIIAPKVQCISRTRMPAKTTPGT